MKEAVGRRLALEASRLNLTGTETAARDWLFPGAPGATTKRGRAARMRWPWPVSTSWVLTCCTSLPGAGVKTL